MWPHTKESPTLRVPFCTSTVATGPRPRSRLASTTVPMACRSGLALSSRISLDSTIVVSRSSRPCPVRAETCTHSYSPP